MLSRPSAGQSSDSREASCPLSPTLKKRGIVSLWLFRCRDARLHSLLLRNSIVWGRSCDPGSGPGRPGRQDGGAGCARLHVPASLAGTWRAGGAKPADRTVATTSDCQKSSWPSEIFSGIYSSSWRIVCQKVARRGRFYFEFSRGIKT